MKVCTVVDCSTPVGAKGARGWCTRHYQRFLSTGSPVGTLRPAPAERFFAKLRPAGDCWEWTGSLDDSGYALFRNGRTMRRGHLWAYEHLVAPIPDGLQLDHLCHDPSCDAGVLCPHRRCCNPWHLDPVPPLINSQRGRGARRMRCPHGHRYTPENTYTNPKGAQVCRVCMADSRARYEAKRRTNVG